MPDRADYLARLLLTRFRQLETALEEEGGSPDDESHAKRLEDAVAKVLAVEEGVTDGATVQLIASAVPPTSPVRAPSDREYEELATFLRSRLRF